MICAKCKKEFEESELELSHDVPCYLFPGKNRKEKSKKADKFGRKYLCLECHDKYERFIYGFVVSKIPQEIKDKLIPYIKSISLGYYSGYFKKKNETNKKISNYSLENFSNNLKTKQEEIIKYCIERGILVDEEVLEYLKKDKKWKDLINKFSDKNIRILTMEVILNENNRINS